jgi:hypothetical protein
MIGLAEIAPTFEFVVGKGLVPSHSSYEPTAFGDAAIEMVGTPFSLRFARDRGQVFVDIGGETVGWYKLEHALAFVNDSTAKRQLGDPPQAALLAQLLTCDWDKLMDLFTDGDRIEQLREFCKERSDNLLRRLFRTP